MKTLNEIVQAICRPESFSSFCYAFIIVNEKSGKINSENRGGYEKIQAVFVDDGGCADIFPVQQCLCCRRDG